MTTSPATQSSTSPTSDASDDLRRQVADAYTDALERSRTKKTSGCGCGCGPDGETAKSEKAASPAGAAARVAGYDEESRDFADTAASSFGCGNPLAFAGVEAGQTVVDLGSGAGFDLLIAARKVGPEGRVIGVDMTDAMIEAAWENARREGFEQIEVRKGLIEELPVADGEADWVISNCVINLSPEKDRVFAEIRRVLAPGGRFSVSDIVARDLPDALRDHAAAYAACIAGAISEDDYVDGLRAAGLDDVEVAERRVYSPQELRGIVGSDLETHGLDPSTFDDLLDEVEGKVASVRFTGRRT